MFTNLWADALLWAYAAFFGHAFYAFPWDWRIFQKWVLCCYQTVHRPTHRHTKSAFWNSYSERVFCCEWNEQVFEIRKKKVVQFKKVNNSTVYVVITDSINVLYRFFAIDLSILLLLLLFHSLLDKALNHHFASLTHYDYYQSLLHPFPELQLRRSNPIFSWSHPSLFNSVNSVYGLARKIDYNLLSTQEWRNQIFKIKTKSKLKR